MGHGVTFINDSYPRATNANGELQTEQDWVVERTFVKKGASIGSGSAILSKVTIGEYAIVGCRQRRHQRCTCLRNRGRQSRKSFALSESQDISK